MQKRMWCNVLSGFVKRRSEDWKKYYFEVLALLNLKFWLFKNKNIVKMGKEEAKKNQILVFIKIMI